MTPIEKAAADVLSTARAEIRQKAPYVMTTVLALIPVWVPNLKTLAVTEGMVLAIDPDWFATLEPKKAAAAVYHESEHIIRNHLPRVAHIIDHALANKGLDLAINGQIARAGWELPHGIFPKDYGFPEDLAAEEYIQLLLKRREAQQKAQQQKPQQQQQSGGSGGPPQPGKGGKKPGDQQTPGEQGKGPKPQDAPGEGQGVGDPDLPDGHAHTGVGSGNCGGIAGNAISKELEQALDAQYGRSAQEQAAIAKAQQSAIKEHVKQHGRGSVPGGLAIDLDVAKETGEVSWNAELRYILRKTTGNIEAGGMDHSLARVSKRSYARGRPMPGLIQRTPEVAVILDTSASMGAEQMKDSVVEMVSMMRALGIDLVWLIQADTRVATPPVRVRARDLLGKIKVHGRGGTDFDDALRVMTKLKPRPDICIYYTDGDGRATFKPPGIAVIWCVVRSRWNRKPVAEFGHTIMIAENEKVKAAPAPKGRAL